MADNHTELASLIEYIDRVRAGMESVLEEIDPKFEISPGWTIREVICHITAWEIVIDKAVKVYLAGDPPFFLLEQDFDIFNDEAVDCRGDWTLDQVFAEWKNVRAALRDTIGKLKETDLEVEMVLPWGSERTVAELIEIIGEHESEHMDEIKKAVE